MAYGDGHNSAQRKSRHKIVGTVLAMLRMMRRQDVRGQNRRVALILGGVFTALWVGSLILMILRN